MSYPFLKSTYTTTYVQHIIYTYLNSTVKQTCYIWAKVCDKVFMTKTEGRTARGLNFCYTKLYFKFGNKKRFGWTLKNWPKLKFLTIFWKGVFRFGDWGTVKTVQNRLLTGIGFSSSPSCLPFLPRPLGIGLAIANSNITKVAIMAKIVFIFSLQQWLLLSQSASLCRMSLKKPSEVCFKMLWKMCLCYASKKFMVRCSKRAWQHRKS